MKTDPKLYKIQKLIDMWRWEASESRIHAVDLESRLDGPRFSMCLTRAQTLEMCVQNLEEFLRHEN